jgi:hypothetical protein
MTSHRAEVRRDDEELIGFVEPDGCGSWRYLTVFGGELGTAVDEGSAVAELHRLGLGVLAERWWFRGEPVTIVEASPGRARDHRAHGRGARRAEPAASLPNRLRAALIG